MADARTFIATIFADNAAPLSIDGSAALDDIKDWDSLSMVALVLRIEQHIGRELNDDEVESLRTVLDVQRLLDAR